MKKFVFFFVILISTGTLVAQNVLYAIDFESGVGDATIVGSGQLVSEPAPFGQVFHNAVGGQAIRSNYLKLPASIFADLQASGSKELTIAFWVNRGTAVDYFWTPLFSAYGAAPVEGANTWPMMVLQSRLVGQVNVAGWSDLIGSQNLKSENFESTVWLDDNQWHYYTAVFTETNVKVYVDGIVQNEWSIDGVTPGQVVGGLFTNGSELGYIALGGNQAWNWADPDPAYKFDDLVVYSTALSSEQINANRAAKYLLTVSTNTDASDMTDCADCDMVVSEGALLNVNASRVYNSVTVRPGASLTFQPGFSITGDIRLESDAAATATLIDHLTSPSMNATVQQYTEAGRNWYMSSPVTNASYSVLNRGNSVAEFDETNKSWTTVNAGTLVPGKGYIQVASEGQGTSGTVTFEGILNAGDISVNLTRTGVAQAGFNLVGNPYPSYLDWSTAASANTNVLPTLWFRTLKTAEAGGGYTFSTVNVAVPSSPIVVANDANSSITHFIPPMQAYWVRLVEGAETNVFTVNNTMRAHADNSGNKFKVASSEQTPLLRLQLMLDGTRDETVVYFNDNASDRLDRFDSPKMNGGAGQLSIFTYADAEKLVINGLATLESDKIVDLGIDGPTGKMYTLHVKELSSMENVEVVLRDNLLSANVLIVENQDYVFSVGQEEDAGNRFSLLFRAPGVVSDLSSSVSTAMQVFSPSKGLLMIDAPEGSSYAVYNILGQKILEDMATQTSTLLKMNTFLSFVPGVYIVRVLVNTQHFTARVRID